MSKTPIIFAIDDDPQVLKAIERDLRKAYRKEYKILSTSSAKEALEAIAQLKLQGDDIALFLSDQKMPEMEGVDFLEKAKVHYPEAKRILLTAYSDTDAAIKAINDVQLDYYLLKPWDPPQEKLYPVINDQLDEWQSTYRPDFQGIRVVGYQYSSKSHELKDFLSGNLIPYQWIDVEKDAKAEDFLKLGQAALDDLPLVIMEDGKVFKSPTKQEVAQAMGKNAKATEEVYDVAIIGAGPAGLAAAVYGGSEGLKTVLIEKRAPGGQAGTSSRIENYLGFPKGLSGSELSRRAISQATRFGIEFLSPQEVNNITIRDGYKILTLQDNSEVATKALIITTGVDYRKLEVKGVDQFSGAGIYYGAAMTEANACKEKDIYVVGGGNSAGQAAMYLSKFARHVFIVIRKTDLTSSMSQYLIDQIDGTQNISVLGRTVVNEAIGEEKLEKLHLKNLDSDETKEVDSGGLFIFIGAKPYTDWLDEVLKNERGYIKTGQDLVRTEGFGKQWKLDREPYLLETSIPGIFAAGDVRSGAMNRVASAVGEGSMAIKFVHEYLSEN